MGFWISVLIAFEAVYFAGLFYYKSQRLSNEVKKLKKPNWYWDNNCLESSAESIEDATCEYDIGEVIELRPVHELPLIFVVRDDTGNEEFSSEEEAERAAEKWSDI